MKAFGKVQSRRWVATLLGLVAGTLTLGAFWFGASAESQGSAASETPKAALQTGPHGATGPCGGLDGQPITVDDLTSAVSFRAFVPNDSLASPASVTSVVVCPNGDVEMEFNSGVGILERSNTIQDPKSAWTAMAADSPADTSVGLVLGEPAAMIDPQKFGALGSVTFVTEGTYIVVVGSGEQTLSQIASVAESLKSA
jgi:hypothetical protein